MTHIEAADALKRVADEVSLLKGRGERFFVERMKIERRVRALAEEVERLDPERRRKAFKTAIIAAKGRIIPVSAGRARGGRVFE